MGKLTERLKDPTRSGVFRTTRLDEVQAAVRDARLDFARVPLKDARSKDELLAAIARELAFPKWFGGNWDALEDCLTDLSWRAAEGHVLAFEAFQGASADDLGIFVDVLASSADFWKTRGRPFFAVLVDPDHVLGLADLFREG